MKTLKTTLIIAALAAVLYGMWAYANGQSVNLLYKGESEHWKGIYRITGDDRYWEDRLTVTYRGTDVSPETEVVVEYDSTAGGGRVHTRLGRDRTVELHSGGNGALPLRSEPIRVSVEWQGKQEMMELKSD